MRQGRQTGILFSSAVAIAASLLGAAPAQAAVTLPQSTGASGGCVLGGTIDTDTATFVGTGTLIPGTHVADQPGDLPDVRVLECTTVSVGNTTIVGSRALEIRASGPVTINGVLSLSARPGGVSDAPGPGGSFGGVNGTFGGGPSGGGPGSSGSTDGPGTGGTGGPASGPHPGGAAGDPGVTPTTTGFGGGGGGAGQGAFAEVPRGVPSHESAAMRGGSGGGSGGASRPAFNSAGGQGGPGGGALRIITPASIVVEGGGGIRADARPGLPGSGSGDGGGGGGGGGGGMIQLIAPSIALSAGSTLTARGGIGGTGDGAGAASGGEGRNGRIRLITNSLDDQAATTPDVELAEAYSVAVEAARAGSGTGSVTSSPAGINCPPDCAEPFDPDVTVSLTATADAGSTFDGWSGACAGAGTATTCPLVTDDSGPDLLHSVSATFRSVPADGGGSGGGGGGGGGSDPGPGPDPGPDPGSIGPRADLAVRGPSGRVVGEGVYSPAGGQRSVARIAPGERASFEVGIENDGDETGSFELRLADERAGFKLGYRFENRRVDPAQPVSVEDLGPGERRTLVVNARATSSARPGTVRRFAIRAVAQGDEAPSDAVAIGLRVPR